VERATCKCGVPGMVLVERAAGKCARGESTCKYRVPGMKLVERAACKYARGESYM